MFVCYLPGQEGIVVRGYICSDNRHQSVLEGLLAFLLLAFLLDICLTLYSYLSLSGSPSGSADPPPAAAAAAPPTAAAATADPFTISTKHWPQIPQSQRQAAKPPGTVSHARLFINPTMIRWRWYLTLWLIRCKNKKWSKLMQLSQEHSVRENSAGLSSQTGN